MTTQPPTPATGPPRRRRVHVFCLTYGEPAENDFAPQFEYSLNILNRLTRRVAPIPRFVTPLLAARRARIRCATFRELGWNSPLEGISARQGEILGELLRERRPDVDFDIEVVREFRPPLLPELLDRLAPDPPDDILVIPLYVAESDFTTGISRTDFESWHRKRRGVHRMPVPRITVGFGFDERFADAMAGFVWQYCADNGWSEEDCRGAALVLGAHGTVVTLPAGMNSGAQETGNLFRLLRKRLGGRFGWMRIAWLNHELGGMWTCPSAEDSVREAHERGFRRIVYFPFGFVGDNGESMLEGRAALDAFEWDAVLYLPCPNGDRGVLAAMADRAVERLDGPEEEWDSIGRGDARFERPEMPALPGQPGLLRFSSPVLATCAALFWALVGVMLAWRGWDLARGLDGGGELWWPLAFAALVTWAKGQFILAKLARKNLRRLRALPQPSPLSAMFSRASWIVIGFFVCVGVALRFTPMPDGLRAGILLGVGGAMLVGVASYLRNFRAASPIEPVFGRAPSGAEAT